MLTVAIYFLSQYPEVFARLRNEIIQRVGPTQRPTYDDIKEMKYLRAVLNGTYERFPISSTFEVNRTNLESMRLYPAV